MSEEVTGSGSSRTTTSSSKPRTRRDFGAVRQLPSKRWQAKYRHPQTREWITAPETYRTKTEASEWLAGVRTDLSRGVLKPLTKSQDVTLSEYVDPWLVQRKVRDTTRQDYKKLADAFIVPQLGHFKVSALSPALIRKWFAELTQVTTENRRAKAYTVLRAILNTAVEDELLIANPCKIKGGSTTPVAERPVPTVDEVFKISGLMVDRYKTLVVFLAFSGLRIGEAVALTWDDIDLKAGTVSVDRRYYRKALDEPKTHAGIRTVHIPEFLTAALKQHAQDFPPVGSANLVFGTSRGTHLDQTSFANYFKRCTTHKTVKHPELRPHDLRHAGATMAADTGASLKTLMARLGHSTPRAALIYQHASTEADKRIAEALNGLGKPA